MCVCGCIIVYFSQNKLLAEIFPDRWRNTALQCFAYPLFPFIPNWLHQRAGREKTSSLTMVHVQRRKFREVIHIWFSKKSVCGVIKHQQLIKLCSYVEHCPLCFYASLFLNSGKKWGKQAVVTVELNGSCMVRKINTNTTVRRLTVFAMI